MLSVLSCRYFLGREAKPLGILILTCNDEIKKERHIPWFMLEVITTQLTKILTFRVHFGDSTEVVRKHNITRVHSSFAMTLDDAMEINSRMRFTGNIE